MAYPEDDPALWSADKIAAAKLSIEKLKAAMAQGASRVRFADREVTYRDLDDMQEQLRIMRAELSAALDATTGVVRVRRPSRYLFSTRKGLC